MSVVISGVRLIADRLNQKEKEQKNRTAHSELIKQLAEMEKAYAKAQSAPPDYDKLLPEAPGVKQAVTKSQDELKSMADAIVKERADEYKSKQNEYAADKIFALEQRQQQASEKLQSDLDSAYGTYTQNARKIDSATIRQGLTQSTIRDEWQKSNLSGYLSGYNDIQRVYELRLADIGKQISAVNEAKKSALYDYNLKLASEYEKVLAGLNAEQLKEIERISEYNKAALAEQQKREARIAELEQEWRKTQSKLRESVDASEREDGYYGEKQLEMQKRLQLATDFYKGIDKREALRLIGDNKAELRNALGLYFDKLVESISA